MNPSLGAARRGRCGAAGALLLAAACSGTPGSPVASLAGPVALAAAPTPDAGTRVFIADADREELRVYNPATELFERGPNAISPLAVPVGFRPTRLSGGTAPGAAANVGFVLVSGASDRFVVIDAATMAPAAPSATDARRCATGDVPASCPGGPVLDVGTGGAFAYAVVDAPAGGRAALAIYSVAQENGAPALAFARAVELDGRPASVGVAADGSRAWVGDTASPRIFEVDSASGAVRALSAGAPVRRVFPVPAYTAEDGTERPAGALLLALLPDGSLQTIDVAAGAPAADPFDATRPAAPLSFFTPVRDVTFVPCTGTPCRVAVRTGANAAPLALPALAFAGLGDGTAAALVPDAAAPAIFRPVDLAAAGPAATAASYTDPAPVAGAPQPTLTVDAAALTEGVTRLESFKVTFRGAIPGFARRPATLDLGAAPVLRDSRLGLVTQAGAQAGDLVRITTLHAKCSALTQPLELRVVSVADEALTLTSPQPPLDPSCGPAPVVYELRAGGATPWVVAGTFTGYAGRARTGAPFTVQGTRFFYPAGGAAGPAVRFTVEGTEPAVADAQFTFSTTSGLTPFVITPGGSTPGSSSLANGVAATADRLFIAVSALRELTGTVPEGGVFVQAKLATLGEADSVKAFR